MASLLSFAVTLSKHLAHKDGQTERIIQDHGADCRDMWLVPKAYSLLHNNAVDMLRVKEGMLLLFRVAAEVKGFICVYVCWCQQFSFGAAGLAIQARILSGRPHELQRRA